MSQAISDHSVQGGQLWLVKAVFPLRGKERVRHGQKIAVLADSAPAAIDLAKEYVDKSNGDWSAQPWGNCVTVMHFTTDSERPKASAEERAARRARDANRPATTRIR